MEYNRYTVVGNNTNIIHNIFPTIIIQECKKLKDLFILAVKQDHILKN